MRQLQPIYGARSFSKGLAPFALGHCRGHQKQQAPQMRTSKAALPLGSPDIMLNRITLFLFAFTLSFGLTSCDLARGIFKAGFYSAFILIILIVVLGVFLIRRFR